MAYNPDFTGRYPKDTYASILNTDMDGNIYNSTGSQVYLANLTSSWAVSASWPTPVAGGGTTLYTGSTYPITSSWAISASWAPSSGPVGGTVVTQSFFDIPLKEMIFETTVSGVDAANIVYLNDVRGTTIWPDACIIRYINFYGDGLDGTTSRWVGYSGKIPSNFINGFTYSFQYFDFGTNAGAGGERPNTVNKVYWDAELWVVSDSTLITSTIDYPILIERKQLTQSFAGVTHDSRSIINMTLMFNDPSNNITNKSLYSLLLARINSNGTSHQSGDQSNYSGSIGILSSKVIYNAG